MANPISLAMRPVHWLALAGLSVLWGGSFFFVEIALTELPTVTIVALRVSVAALALLAYLLLTGVRLPRTPGLWGAFAFMALLNNALPFLCLVWAQGSLTAGLASILNATTPLFGLVVAHFLTRDEPLSGARATGVAVGCVGVAVLVGPAAFGAGDDLALLAMGACIAAALSYAFASVFGRRFAATGLDPVTVAARQLCASSLMLWPLAVVVDAPWTLSLPSPGTMAAVATLAIASTAAAYVIYFRLLAAVGAGNLLFVTQLVPVSAILLGVVVLGDALVAREIGAMLLIAGGLALTDPRVRALLLGRRAARGARP